VPLPPPIIYAAPTPALLVPPINPGPAVVPPAGLSPLLKEPGPIYQLPEREGPSYPPPPTPGPIDQQKKRSRIAMVCAINNGSYSVKASVRAASAAAKSSSS
jgi:hypothetical protein